VLCVPRGRLDLFAPDLSGSFLESWYSLGAIALGERITPGPCDPAHLQRLLPGFFKLNRADPALRDIDPTQPYVSPPAMNSEPEKPLF
jgi:hypothetical protein